eukprot:scaffold25830_cov162-Cylindrotheca_fusiformis.AAC.6
MKNLSLFFCLLIIAIDGFVPTPSSKSLPKAVFASEPTTASLGVSEEGRRNLLALAGPLFLAIPLVKQNGGQGKLQQVQEGMTVDQALERIESDCDRRFLHAVVASGYHFLYSATASRTNQISMQTYTENSESILTTYTNSRDYGISGILKERLKDRPIQPQSSQIGFANPDDVKNRQTLVSVWPMGQNVHFAWMEQGTSFSTVRKGDNLIVDGVDCGRMALEDALEEGKEVMFETDRYLVVPRSFEKELVAKLQSGFLI